MTDSQQSSPPVPSRAGADAPGATETSKLGMTFDGVVELLKLQGVRNVTVSDIEIVSLVTMLNEFLRQQELLMSQHNKALTAIMGKTVEQFRADADAVFYEKMHLLVTVVNVMHSLFKELWG